LRTVYLFLLVFRFRAGARRLDAFIGWPQHQMVFAEVPQQSTTTSLPQGTHANFFPFFVFAIPYLLLVLPLQRPVRRTLLYRHLYAGRFPALGSFLPGDRYR